MGSSRKNIIKPLKSKATNGKEVEQRRVPENKWDGNIDGLNGRLIFGWLKERGSDDALIIDIYVNDVRIVEGCIANNFRSDLFEAGVGEGNHGFNILLPSGLEIASELAIVTVKLTGEYGVILSFTFPWSKETSLWEAYIEGMDGRRVFGWLKKVGNNSPQRVDVYLNEQLAVPGYLADCFRQDVLDAGHGNGRYGFEITISSAPNIDDSEVIVSLKNPEDGQIIVSKRFLNHPFKDSYKWSLDKSEGNKTLRGWCINENRPDDVFDLDLYLDGHFYVHIRNDGTRGDLKKKGISGGLGGFSLPNPVTNHFRGGEHTFALRFPDGSYSQARLVSEAPRREENGLILLRDRFPRRAVTIIVPIYNAAEDVEVCIQRLLAHTPTFARFLLIDDASTDDRIDKILAKYAFIKNIQILRNAKNIGFTRTVNRGIMEVRKDDVILLNSDTRVTPGWLEGMLMASCLNSRVATVTAMSDRAGAFSAPQMGNENRLPEGVDEITFARTFRRHSLGLYPRVPTGNGFCMYVNRDCINSIGPLDEKAFPRGYGEENDFCMRALRAGWIHLIDDRTYVFHDRSKSFGESKTGLMKSGRAIVDKRYPEYRQAIGIFSSCEKIALARNRASFAMQLCMDGKIQPARLLFVIATQTGGTPQTNKDLINALSETIEGWVLRCDSQLVELTHISNGKSNVVRIHELSEPVDPASHSSLEYDIVVSTWLYEFDFDLVHIRHLAWHGLSLPRLARQLGKKVVFSFHDFYALSPTIKLIDDAGVFLGDGFLEEGSIYRESLWPTNTQPKPSGEWLKFWRDRFVAALLNCDAFVTTSDSARQLILKAMSNLPADRFVVIPHGRDFPDFHRLRNAPVHGQPIRIVLPGNINAAKGLEIIKALSEYDKCGHLEFHVLGSLSLDTYDIYPNIYQHGEYKRSDFAKKVSLIRPHVGAIFSIWDETYCHTLTELWSVGIPALVFDFPNVASRVQKSGAGWILKNLEIPLLYEEILRTVFNFEESKRIDIALTEWQKGAGVINNSRLMAAEYMDVYSSVLKEAWNTEKFKVFPNRRKRIGVLCPSDKDLFLANASTHIRVWERTHNTFDRNVVYIRMTPDTVLASVCEKVIDGLIIQRTAVPFTMVEKLLSELTSAAVPFMLDLDDDLLNVPEDKDLDRRYADYKPFLLRLINHAANVTVSTIDLQNDLQPLNPNTRLLPNLLSDRLWRPDPPERITDDLVRAVYMGTATHGEDLAMVLPALDLVAAEMPRFRLTLIGAIQSDELIAGRDWIERLCIPNSEKSYNFFVPWLRAKTKRFDFAIAPLLDTTFNRRKSDLKLLEYAALGLPVLASNICVYQKTAETSGIPSLRLIENTMDQWVHALETQIYLGQENRSLGAQLREWVLHNRMLGQTLCEFDAMILRMVGGETNCTLDNISGQTSFT